MFSSDPQSLDTRGGGSLHCGGWAEKVVVSHSCYGRGVLAGKGSGRGDTSLAAWVQRPAPPTQLIVDGTHRSLTYILASATGSDSPVFFFFCPGFGVYLQDCKFVDGVLPVWVLFQYWFEESSGGSFFQALDTTYSYVLLKHLAPESGPRCDQGRICWEKRETLRLLTMRHLGDSQGLQDPSPSLFSKEPWWPQPRLPSPPCFLWPENSLQNLQALRAAVNSTQASQQKLVPVAWTSWETTLRRRTKWWFTYLV